MAFRCLSIDFCVPLISLTLIFWSSDYLSKEVDEMGVCTPYYFKLELPPITLTLLLWLLTVVWFTKRMPSRFGWNEHSCFCNSYSISFVDLSRLGFKKSIFWDKRYRSWNLLPVDSIKSLLLNFIGSCYAMILERSNGSTLRAEVALDNSFSLFLIDSSFDARSSCSTFSFDFLTTLEYFLRL